MKNTKKTTTKSSGKAKPAKSRAPALKKEASKVPESTTTPIQPPKTGEQVADITKAANSFEGYKDISQLPFEEQLSHVFNPLHTITKTAVPNKITPSTFVVSPGKK